MFNIVMVFLIGGNLLANDVEIKGRSLADYCPLLYRIETDFQINTVDPEMDAVAVWLKDRYTNEFILAQTFDRLGFTLVTMSQNPKYLAHEIFFTVYSRSGQPPEKPEFKANFSDLMRKCFESHQRDQVKFQQLKIESAE